MGWWVNQPGSRSVKYPTRKAARRTARQLSRGSVSRAPKGRHSDGCLVWVAAPVLTVCMAIVAIVGRAI
jgi:hypothetical protein